MSEQKRRRVALVFGGRSSEHAISCVSAGSVLAALDGERWDVVPVGITPDGRWVLEPGDPDKLTITGDALPQVDESGASVLLSPDPTAAPFSVQEPGRSPRALADVDVVFPLLHGPYGEDGTIQGLLELAGLPYVGSGVLASAVAMDKVAMKVMLAGAGLAVAPFVVVGPDEWARDRESVLARVASDLVFPVFVKPARGGSSVGVSRVDTPDGLVAAIDAARAEDPKVLVEQGIQGRELECGVLDDGSGLRASVAAEISFGSGHEFYDFEAKYLEAVEVAVPADLTADELTRVQRLALDAFAALGCEGLARVDCFLTAGGELVVNEVNTMPGFTPTSMFPRMWAASGLSYPELVDALLAEALARPTGLR